MTKGAMHRAAMGLNQAFLRQLKAHMGTTISRVLDHKVETNSRLQQPKVVP